MKKVFFIMLIVLIAKGVAHAQTNIFPATGSVGVGTLTPNASALLELQSTSNGLLIPRMTRTQRDAIVSPATGLMIFQTNSTPGLYFYSGTTWQNVSNGRANTNLGNLSPTTAINSGLLPATTGTIDLGSASKAWRDGYFSGNLTIANGAQGAGKVLTSDANGLANWQSLPAVVETDPKVGSFTSNQVPKWTGTSLVDGSITDNGTNIGIGTNSPGKKLEVSGVGGLKVSSTNNSTSNTTDWIAGNFGNATLGGDRIVMGNLLGDATIGAHNSALTGWAHLNINRDGGNVVIGNMYPSYKLTVNGSTYCVSGAWMGSDVRYKKNIQTIGNALQRVLQLRGVTYEFRTDEFPNLNFEKDKQIGVIAQEVEKVFPELVKTDPEGYKAVAYDKIAPLLIEAIKEQQAQIDAKDAAIAAVKKQMDIKDAALAELKNEVAAIKAMLTNSAAKPVAGINQQVVSFESNSLEQNIPNPPAGNFTKINYNIPNAATKAELIIVDNAGRKIKTISLNSFGKGVLNVNTKGLASGIYTYSMYVDGKIIDSKKMVVAK